MKKAILSAIMLSPALLLAQSYTSFQNPHLEAPQNSICKLSHNSISTCVDLSSLSMETDKTKEIKPSFVFKTKQRNGNIEFSDIPKYNSEKIDLLALQEKQNISLKFD